MLGKRLLNLKDQKLSQILHVDNQAHIYNKHYKLLLNSVKIS